MIITFFSSSGIAQGSIQSQEKTPNTSSTPGGSSFLHPTPSSSVTPLCRPILLRTPSSSTIPSYRPILPKANTVTRPTEKCLTSSEPGKYL